MIEIDQVDHDSRSWRGVTVRIDGRAIDLSWRWLRDHSRDPASFHAAAQQRLVTPSAVAAAGVGRAHVDASDDATLVVTWDDGTVARYTANELTQLASADAMYPAASPEAVAWRGDEAGSHAIELTADELMSDDGLRRAIASLDVAGLVMFTDVPIDDAATRSVLERFGYVRQTIFGDLWNFSADDSAGEAFDDTASTPLEITPHTDGTYSNDAPGLLGLHCHRYDATGGDNVFVDGRAVSERIAAESPRHHELLCSVEIPGRYIGDGAHLVARRPVLRHEGGEFVQISYNHHDRAPFLLPEPLMTEVFDALHHVDMVANDAAMQLDVTLRPGDMVVFDNWRLLHGRRAFTGARHIAGGYINREDLASTRRRLE